MSKKKILITFGTRPEALKLVPLIRELQASKHFEVKICVTGQHRQMLDQVIDFFKIPVHDDMNIMRKNQTLEQLTSRVIESFAKKLRKHRPDLVFVQGDTTTAFAVGLSCFYAKIKLAHLEAGLRTWNKSQPFPEEINRVLLTHLADYHFTPTRQSSLNLRREGVPAKSIYEVGNTVVDTVRITSKKIKTGYEVFKNLIPGKRILFVTAHRRESFGQGLQGIFDGFKQLVREFPDIQIVYPVHLNPNVFNHARKELSAVGRIHLLRPLSYEETHWILKKAYLVLTDSGGIQEEAPSFGKPVLVLRKVTERPEGVRQGVAKLVGTDTRKIILEARKLLKSQKAYRIMKAGKNPYGDGKASKRIVRILKTVLK